MRNTPRPTGHAVLCEGLRATCSRRTFTGEAAREGWSRLDEASGRRGWWCPECAAVEIQEMKGATK